jgi:hypothetical protein
MAMTIEDGRPNWLAAYPNEGALDYFGGRFYRQPNRAHLVRGAAANDFKNAKTLLFYSALCYAFRESQKLALEETLSEGAFAQWQRWFKNANFLYVVNYYAQYNEVPDRGFTGAIEAYHNFFEGFYKGDVKEFRFDAVYDAFYPEQRQWGYLAQFWRAPLHYFRTVLSIEECQPGEYGKDCFSLFSQYDGWNTFISIIQAGILTKDSLLEIQDVLDCRSLSNREQSLARDIIFDHKNVSGEENDFYKTSFNIIEDLLSAGAEGREVKKSRDFASVFTYKHLQNEKLEHDQEYWWQIVITSLAFDCGIHRLYSLLGQLADNDILVTEKVNEAIEDKVTKWLVQSEIENTSLESVCESWKNKNLSSYKTFDNLYKRLIDYQNIDTFIDGIIMGYLASTVELPEKVVNTESYLELTNDYHHFIPRVFFRKRADQNSDFLEFIRKTVFRLIEEQYEFSIVRMGYGQKAKFILIKDEVTGNYIFQIDARTYKENQGIINMIDACLSLWSTAGLIEH